MNTYRHIQKFIVILLVLIIVTGVLVYVNHDFFLDVDYRENAVLVIADAEIINTINKDECREYKLIYDELDEHSVRLKDNIQRVLDITKVKYSIYERNEDVTFESDDYVILTLINWTDNKAIVEDAFAAVESGASMFAAFIPVFDRYFMSKADIMGIADAVTDEQSEKSDGYVFKGDILLGQRNGDKLMDTSLSDMLYKISVDDTAKVYIENQNGVPIYFTKEYGEGCIGLYNGQVIAERYMDGLIVGILGTTGQDYVYPIINTGLMFIDDWPGPFRGHNDIIDEQYGMNVDDFMRYVWWPDMLSFAKRYDIKYIGQYVLSYNDVMEPPFINQDVKFDTDMYAFGQQIIKYGGELGLHGYNHQPLYYDEYCEDCSLSYKKWDSYDNSVLALNEALAEFKDYYPSYKINSYVPPSNVISDEGIEAVKEVLGEPVVVCGMYMGDEECYVEHQDIKYEDGVIYLPRFSAGSFADDMTKINIAMSVSMYGVISHFIHPDDVMDEQRNRGKTWEELRNEYSKLMEYIEDRYPCIEYQTVTQSAQKTVDWYNQDYCIDYNENYIHVKAERESENITMILRTSKEVLGTADYEVYQCGEQSYYIKLNKSDVRIMLKGRGQ